MKSFLGITVNYFVIKTCSENWKISRSTFKSHGLVLILSGMPITKSMILTTMPKQVKWFSSHLAVHAKL